MCATKRSVAIHLSFIFLRGFTSSREKYRKFKTLLAAASSISLKLSYGNLCLIPYLCYSHTVQNSSDSHTSTIVSDACYQPVKMAACDLRSIRGEGNKNSNSLVFRAIISTLLVDQRRCYFFLFYTGTDAFDRNLTDKEIVQVCE